MNSDNQTVKLNSGNLSCAGYEKMRPKTTTGLNWVYFLRISHWQVGFNSSGGVAEKMSSENGNSGHNSCGCWGLNTGLLEEQPVRITSKRSLQPSLDSFVCLHSAGLVPTLPANPLSHPPTQLYTPKAEPPRWKLRVR